MCQREVQFAMSTFGKKEIKSADWIKALAEELLPLLEEKRRALSADQNLPSEMNLQALHTARSRIQQTTRRCASDCCLQLCTSIQIAASSGNIRGMHEGFEQAIGPIQKKPTLKTDNGEIMKDREQQMNHWVKL